MVQTIFAGAADADERPGNMLKIDRKIFAAEMQIGMVGAIPGLGCHLAGEVGPAGVVDQRRRAGVPEDVNLRAKGAGETGVIETDMTRALTDEQRAGTLAAVPAGRLGTPNEIASAVAFLASDEASYITGETLHVNGGMYMV